LKIIQTSEGSIVIIFTQKKLENCVGGKHGIWQCADKEVNV